MHTFHVEMSLTCAGKNLFQYERSCTKTRFQTEVRATRKWLILSSLLCLCEVRGASLSDTVVKVFKSKLNENVIKNQQKAKSSLRQKDLAL